MGGGEERGRIRNELRTEHRAQRGAPTHDPEMTTWAESKGQRLSQLQVPLKHIPMSQLQSPKDRHLVWRGGCTCVSREHTAIDMRSEASAE